MRSGPLLRLLALLAVLTPAAAVHAQDVQIELENFGVGNRFRPGDLVGIKLRVTSRASEAQNIQLVWETENADGDVAEHQRLLAVSPGQPTSRWLYARLSPRADPTSVWTVRVYADDDGDRGAELGSTRITPSQATASAALAIEQDQSAVAVFGMDGLGFDGYAARLPGEPYPRAANEDTRTVTGLDLQMMPDRWEGLAQYAVIAWVAPSPQALSLDQADAIREYVRRGGHFIINLPQAGNPWSLGTPDATRLSDLLPTVAPLRVEGAPYWWLTQVLAKSSDLRNPDAEVNIQVFDTDTLDNGWEPMVVLPADPPRLPEDSDDSDEPAEDSPVRALTPELADALDAAVVVVQRRYGFGVMTLLGIDVDATNRRRLVSGGLPQADAFWNRILGRRQDTPTAGALKTLLDATPPRIRDRPITTINSLGSGELVGGQIGMSGQAALGTVAALLLFAVYWVVAGPGGYALLRQAGLVRHAWLLFVATSVVFTLVAWGGGTALRLRDIRTQHVTYVDSISAYGGVDTASTGGELRATSWFSLYLPGYGPTRVSLGGTTGHRDLLFSWSPPPSGSTDRFPNVDRYVVPFGSPADYALPARATATQLEARWLGTASEGWGRLPYALDGAPITQEVRDGSVKEVSLSGTLQHALSGPLEDVVIVHVGPARTPLRRLTPGPLPLPVISGELPSFGRMSILASWDPGTPLDLRESLYSDGPQRIPDRSQATANLPNGLSEYTTVLLDASGVAAGFGSEYTSDYMQMLSLFEMLDPPAWFDTTGTSFPDTVRANRVLGRQLDLSSWFNRPCLIILGTLRNSSSPVPVLVEGEEVPSEGVTVVRWICPLPVVPRLTVPEARPEEFRPPGG